MHSIVHMTTVHPRHDIRIWIKEAASLSRHGTMQVAVFVQDGQGPEKDESTGVQVVDTGPRPASRVVRMSIGAWRMWRAVRRARPDMVHFHDPELIPAGLMLKLSGIKVIYDVHEDVPQQILDKDWLPGFARRCMARGVDLLQRLAGRSLDGIVAATPTIAKGFPGSKTAVVRNFPIQEELIVPDPVPYTKRAPYFVYVGGITPQRGVREMLQAVYELGNVQARLCLAGSFDSLRFEREVKAISGWTRVDYKGWADRPGIARLLGSARAGLVLLHPTPNYLYSMPIKMFEYMAAGLPVIASDFPLWREIVDGAGCGLLVDPLDPEAIAETMQWVLDHPAEAEAMGRRGRRAAAKKYNWEREAKKLIRLYQRLLGVGDSLSSAEKKKQV